MAIDVLVHWTGLIASLVLPFFNIPLIIRMIRRRSADDISGLWCGGVMACLLLMLPAALASPDVIFRAFSIVNVVFFAGVSGIVAFFKLIKSPSPTARNKITIYIM